MTFHAKYSSHFSLIITIHAPSVPVIVKISMIPRISVPPNASEPSTLSVKSLAPNYQFYSSC